MKKLEAYESEIKFYAEKFHSLVLEMKPMPGLWEDFYNKSLKFHSLLKNTVTASASVWDSLQSIADATSNSHGTTCDVGASLTRVCIRHKGLENKLNRFTDTIQNSFLIDFHDKLEEWKKTNNHLEREHEKDFKRYKNDIKKMKSDINKLSKKLHKDFNPGSVNNCTPKGYLDCSNKLNAANNRLEYTLKCLKDSEYNYLRLSLAQQRHRVQAFVENTLKPILDIESDIGDDFTKIGESRIDLADNLSKLNNENAMMESLNLNGTLLGAAASTPNATYANGFCKTETDGIAIEQLQCNANAANTFASSREMNNQGMNAKYCTLNPTKGTLMRRYAANVRASESFFTGLTADREICQQRSSMIEPTTTDWHGKIDARSPLPYGRAMVVASPSKRSDITDPEAYYSKTGSFINTDQLFLKVAPDSSFNKSVLIGRSASVARRGIVYGPNVVQFQNQNQNQSVHRNSGIPTTPGIVHGQGNLENHLQNQFQNHNLRPFSESEAIRPTNFGGNQCASSAAIRQIPSAVGGDMYRINSSYSLSLKSSSMGLSNSSPLSSNYNLNINNLEASSPLAGASGDVSMSNTLMNLPLPSQSHNNHSNKIVPNNIVRLEGSQIQLGADSRLSSISSRDSGFNSHDHSGAGNLNQQFKPQDSLHQPTNISESFKCAIEGRASNTSPGRLAQPSTNTIICSAYGISNPAPPLPDEFFPPPPASFECQGTPYLANPPDNLITPTPKTQPLQSLSEDHEATRKFSISQRDIDQAFQETLAILDQSFESFKNEIKNPNVGLMNQLAPQIVPERNISSYKCGNHDKQPLMPRQNLYGTSNNVNKYPVFRNNPMPTHSTNPCDIMQTAVLPSNFRNVKFANNFPMNHDPRKGNNYPQIYR